MVWRDDASVHAFWSNQHGSLHRRSDDAFYLEKAREHAQLMTSDDRESIADFACGAGELLAHLAPIVHVETASDFSESMLDEARSRLEGTGIELLHRDGMIHAREATQRVWMTCGGLNQFLGPRQLREWLELFSTNADAEAIYLFDSIDRHRYRGLKQQSSYVDRSEPASARVRRWAHRVKTFRAAATRRPWCSLGSATMGYAYTPAFFRDLAADLDLDVDFYSSRFYEYRFHTVMRKRRATL